MTTRMLRRTYGAECQRQVEDADIGEQHYVLSQSGRGSTLEESTSIEQLSKLSVVDQGN